MESGDATMVEFHICQGEDTKGNMENPCAYYGTLKIQGLGFRRINKTGLYGFVKGLSLLSIYY